MADAESVTVAEAETERKVSLSLLGKVTDDGLRALVSLARERSADREFPVRGSREQRATFARLVEERGGACFTSSSEGCDSGTRVRTCRRLGFTGFLPGLRADTIRRNRQIG